VSDPNEKSCDMGETVWYAMAETGHPERTLKDESESPEENVLRKLLPVSK